VEKNGEVITSAGDTKILLWIKVIHTAPLMIQEGAFAGS